MYFLEQLIDADEFINLFNWQWVAGIIGPSYSYIRILNHDTQLKKFDKDMTYIKKFIDITRYNCSKIISNVRRKNDWLE